MECYYLMDLLLYGCTYFLLGKNVVFSGFSLDIVGHFIFSLIFPFFISPCAVSRDGQTFRGERPFLAVGWLQFPFF